MDEKYVIIFTNEIYYVKFLRQKYHLKIFENNLKIF